LKKVESEVRLGLEAELEALALADMTTRAETLLASGESMETIANTLDIEWRVELAATRLTSQLPQPVLETAFGMPQVKQMCCAQCPCQGKVSRWFQLARVNPGDVAALSGAEAQQLLDLRSGEQQRLSFDEFLVHQRNVADIVIR
jgi:hypothetical protein